MDNEFNTILQKQMANTLRQAANISTRRLVFEKLSYVRFSDPGAMMNFPMDLTCATTCSLSLTPRLTS